MTDKHLTIVSCPFCQEEVLFLELVLGLEIEVRTLLCWEEALSG